MGNWKVIPGYERYEISDEGEVRNSKTGRLLKSGYTNGGYRKVNLRSNGVAVNARVHRLVAENFLPNTDGKTQVNHIDGDKTNNRVTNLEWCDAKYNTNYGTRNMRLTGRIYTAETRKKISDKVKQYYAKKKNGI